jgi:hypothetical protein
MTARITGPSRQAIANVIADLARGGVDDPSIAVRLGITVAQVRGLRRDFKIAAGERRWIGGGRS